MRRFIKTLLMLAAPISKGMGWPPQKTYAAATLATTSRYKLVNENSTLILGIAPHFLTAGTMALSWSNNGSANHLWQFTHIGSSNDVIPQSLISLFL